MEFAQGYSIAATLGILFCTLSLFVLSKGQRQLVKDRLLGWSSSHSASPRSKELKKDSTEPQPENIALKSYKDALPPSVRGNLPKAAASLPKAQQSILKGDPINEATVKQNLIPFTASYRDAASSVYTPTGVSIEEVKALGDFPDYAALSEVPLPKPYKEFQIDRALPRPYRPFRWAYHQNMCE